MNDQPLAGAPSRAVVLDTETTGLSPHDDRIVEIAACEVIHGKPTGAVFHHYINPERPVPAGASAVHGLNNHFLADKPRFADIAKDFLTFIGNHTTPIFAHNAAFDRRFVIAELDWANHPTALSFKCSLKLARSLKVPTENMKLETLARHIGHDWSDGGAHSALADTKALAAVLGNWLWPLAEERAAQRREKPAPRQANPTNRNRAPTLPEGFVPLTVETDSRIRRYDDFSLYPYCSNHGERWTKDERKRLVEAFLNEGASIEALVKRHGRTPSSLFMKMESLGVIAPGHPYDRNIPKPANNAGTVMIDTPHDRETVLNDLIVEGVPDRIAALAGRIRDCTRDETEGLFQSFVPISNHTNDAEKYWGVRHDVRPTRVLTEPGAGDLEVHFETANRPPQAFVEALSHRYPDLTFRIGWVDPNAMQAGFIRPEIGRTQSQTLDLLEYPLSSDLPVAYADLSGLGHVYDLVLEDAEDAEADLMGGTPRTSSGLSL